MNRTEIAMIRLRIVRLQAEIIKLKIQLWLKEALL